MRILLLRVAVVGVCALGLSLLALAPRPGYGADQNSSGNDSIGSSPDAQRMAGYQDGYTQAVRTQALGPAQAAASSTIPPPDNGSSSSGGGC